MQTQRRTRAWLRGARIIGWAFAALMTVPVLLAILFRTKARGPLRHFNKRTLNPLTLRLAGRGGPYAALHHVGRRSGIAYTTPLVAERTPNGFLIPLVYGEDVDWAKNVLAAGRCTIELHGATYAATDPQIVGFEVAAVALRRGLQLRYRFYGVESFLRLDEETAKIAGRAGEPAAAAAPEAQAAVAVAG